MKIDYIEANKVSAKTLKDIEAYWEEYKKIGGTNEMLTGKIEIGGELQTIHVKTTPEISYQIPRVFTKDEAEEVANKFNRFTSANFSTHIESYKEMYTIFIDTTDRDYRNENEVRDYVINILLNNF